eukprot:SAG11_NODE_3492_length_2414_cov_13.059611_2_plen_84_part_00
MDSPKVGELEIGERIVVSDYRHLELRSGATTLRVKFERGWTSTVSSGGVQMLEAQHAPATSTPRRAAAAWQGNAMSPFGSVPW